MKFAHYHYVTFVFISIESISDNTIDHCCGKYGVYANNIKCKLIHKRKPSHFYFVLFKMFI